MDCRRLSRYLVAVGIALVWGGSVRADAIVSSGTAVSPLFQTGNVEQDMPSSSSSVTTIAGHPFNYTFQPQYMTDAGLINGYAMKDIRLSYDKTTDTLAVGVNFFGVAGNTDGSADGKVNPLTIAYGGSNPAHFGADKSITVGFTPVNAAGIPASTPLVVAGVPAVKTDATDETTDHFTVAAYKNSTGGLPYSYGQTLTNNVGNLAYDPSSAHPGFEFTVKNFSKIPGLNALNNGFYLSAFSGSQQTVIVGKSDIANTYVAPQLTSLQNFNPTNPISPPVVPVPAPAVPEPTTIIAWGLIVGGSAWRFRRRRQVQS